MNKHIITLEDPVEYEFIPLQSIIHQRQLGIDVDSMAHGIRDALREDPDVIMVGELRDRDTLEAALHAAETGHLVLATMHTQRAVMAVQRMISLFLVNNKMKCAVKYHKYCVRSYVNVCYDGKPRL